MPQQIILDDPAQLGGVFLDVDQAYQNADYSSLFKAETGRLEKSHEQLFASEHSPAGEPWAELSPFTVRKKGHDVILHETGRLGASLFSRTADSIRDIGARFLAFGTSVFYSMFHTTGTSRMPRREHVGMNMEQVDGLANRVADDLVRQLKG